MYKYLKGVRKVTNVCKKKRKSLLKYSIFGEYLQVPRYLRVFFSAETFVSIICEFRKNAFVPYDSPGAVRSRSSPRHTYLRRVWFLWGSGKALWRYCGANGALLRRMYIANVDVILKYDNSQIWWEHYSQIFASITRGYSQIMKKNSQICWFTRKYDIFASICK